MYIPCNVCALYPHSTPPLHPQLEEWPPTGPSLAHSLAREGVAEGVVEVQTDEAQKALTKPYETISLGDFIG